MWYESPGGKWVSTRDPSSPSHQNVWCWNNHILPVLFIHGHQNRAAEEMRRKKSTKTLNLGSWKHQNKQANTKSIRSFKLLKLDTTIMLTVKKERWQIWTHRELVDQAPAEFLRDEACDATLPHDLGQLTSITECVRQPELKSRDRVNAGRTFSTCSSNPVKGTRALRFDWIKNNSSCAWNRWKEHVWTAAKVLRLLI